MNKFLTKPETNLPIVVEGKYERFGLTENPFPSEPVVNKDSQDPRINGAIYESEIRRKELEQTIDCFLKQPQSTPNHLRLGYIIDTSFIGRGNGKSAFLVNLQQMINKNFCIDLSGRANKCFGLYVSPEPGGRTKTFPAFVDNCFESMVRSNVIQECLATLVVDAVGKLYPNSLTNELLEDEELANQVSSPEWYKLNDFDVQSIWDVVFNNEYLQQLSPDFPLFRNRNRLWFGVVSQNDFVSYYEQLRKGKERLDFVFSR